MTQIDTQLMEPWGTHRPAGIAAFYLGVLRYKLARGALKRSFRKALYRRGPFYDVMIEGLRIRCHVGDNYSELVALEHGLQNDGTGVQMITQDLRDGHVFVDVGANCGLFTVFAARAVGRTGRVVAIEPLSIMANRLRFNIAANGFGNVSVFEGAVGAEAGEITIYASLKNLGESSVSPSDGSVPIVARTMPLLDVVQTAGITKIDAMKIDIEGHEDQALISFFKTAEGSLWPKRMLVEHIHSHLWETNCVARMIELGYAVSWDGAVDTLLELQ